MSAAAFRTIRAGLPILRLIFCVCLLHCLAGCVPPARDRASAPESIVVLTSAYTPLSARARPSVYILLRDQTNSAQTLHTSLTRQVRARGYEIATHPSRAGHIVQCNVVFAGDMSPGAAARAVPRGYGAVVPRSGPGESVLMADVIVASRNVPGPVRKRHGASLTLGARNLKLDDQHLRLAACLPTRGQGFAHWQASLEERVASAVAELLPRRDGIVQP